MLTYQKRLALYELKKQQIYNNNLSQYEKDKLIRKLTEKYQI
jgi:hypothetical protein